MISTAQQGQLLNEARSARAHAYAPYSQYAVGAAVLAASGNTYRGCNVENASYGLTQCAERVAVAQAISAGERELVAVAVVTADGGSPCGACRQVLSEFSTPETLVLLGKPTEGPPQVHRLADLLPLAFGASSGELGEKPTT